MNDLLKYWHQYIEELEKDKKRNLKSVMTAYAPKLEDTTITVLLDNKIQEQYFNDDKINLTNYLRRNLQNYTISLRSEVIKAELNKVMHTQNDIYKHFLTLNPYLQVFVEKLKLEFDTSKDN